MDDVPYTIGETVYHNQVYDYRESLKIIDMTYDNLLLEGDFSGGTHPVTQRDWLTKQGTSRIRDYRRRIRILSEKEMIRIPNKNGLFICTSRVEYWFKHNVLHRMDGPAQIWPDGQKYWVISGNIMDNEADFIKVKKNYQLIENLNRILQ